MRAPLRVYIEREKKWTDVENDDYYREFSKDFRLYSCKLSSDDLLIR